MCYIYFIYLCTYYLPLFKIDFVLCRKKMMNMIQMVVKRNEVKNVKLKVIPEKKRKGRKENGEVIVQRYQLYLISLTKLNNIISYKYVVLCRRAILAILKKSLLQLMIRIIQIANPRNLKTHLLNTINQAHRPLHKIIMAVRTYSQL